MQRLFYVMEVMDTLKILERLKIVTNSTNYAELARKLNIKDSTIRTWKTRGTIPYEACAIVTLNYNTTLEWLLNGQDTPQNRVNETPAITYNQLSLPFYDLQISIDGSKQACLVENKKLGQITSFSTDYVRNELNVVPVNAFLMHARGDSMNPTIKDGAVLMINKDIEPLIDGIYVIRQDAALLVKRLHNLTSGKIKVISDNEIYQAYEVDKSALVADNVEILGRVVWAGQKV